MMMMMMMMTIFSDACDVVGAVRLKSVRLGIEARSDALTAHGSVLGSAPRVSVQLTPNWLARHSRMPLVRTPVTPDSAQLFLRLAFFLAVLLRLLFLLEQEGFGSEVGLGRVVLELGGFHLRPALQQLCGSRIELLLVSSARNPQVRSWCWRWSHVCDHRVRRCIGHGR